MPVPFNDGASVAAPRYWDLRLGKIVGGVSVPFASAAEAKAAIPSTRRCRGLQVYVLNGSVIEDWQWVAGIADGDLVLKPGTTTPDLQAVSDVGNSTTQPLVSAAALLVIGDDTINNTIGITSPAKGSVGVNVYTGAQGPAIFWTLTGLATTVLLADNADGREIQLPDESGTLMMKRYKSYVGMMTQTGTSNPVITELENDVAPGGLSWSRFGVGAYQLGNAALTANKTIVIGGSRIPATGTGDIAYHQIGSNVTVSGRYAMYVDASDAITLSVRDSSNAAIELGALCGNRPIFFEIRVYN